MLLDTLTMRRGRGPSLRWAPAIEEDAKALSEQLQVEVLVASIRQQPVHRQALTHLGIDLSGAESSA